MQACSKLLGKRPDYLAKSAAPHTRQNAARADYVACDAFLVPHGNVHDALACWRPPIARGTDRCVCVVFSPGPSRSLWCFSQPCSAAQRWPLVLLQLMGGGVNARFDAQGAADEGRIATWRETLRLIADHPWFGTGEGTFVWSFPSYRSADVSMRGVWDHAHSTLLEVAADMGIPFATLLTLVWILIIAILIRAVWCADVICSYQLARSPSRCWRTRIP